MKCLSRRDALRTGAAAFAMAPIPAAAIAAMQVSTAATRPEDDANLLALIAGVPVALDRLNEAGRVCREAYERTLAELGVTCPTLRSIQEEYAARGITLTKTQARGIGDMLFGQASRKCGFDRAYNHLCAVMVPFRALIRRTYATRAHTLEGIAAKQRLAVYLIKRIEYIETYEPVTWIASVSRDLEQIAGRV